MLSSARIAKPDTPRGPPEVENVTEKERKAESKRDTALNPNPQLSASTGAKAGAQFSHTGDV